MKKKRKPIFFVVVAGLSLVAIVGAFLLTTVLYIRSDAYGWNKISQKTDRDGASTVYIQCSEFSGYSIEPVELDEKAYQGEWLVPINNDLGNYVVRVRLHDAKPSGHFVEAYSDWGTYKIGNSELSFMFAYSGGDHGCEIFIGSDTPINVDDIVIKGFNFRTRRFENCFWWLF